MPNSILSSLRRDAVEQLLELRHLATVRPTLKASHQLIDPDRTSASKSSDVQTQLHVLARTLEQVDALLAVPAGQRPSSVCCYFEDVRRYKPAVEACRAAGVPIALATIRIIKPGEEGWLTQVLACAPDAVEEGDAFAAAGFPTRRDGRHA